VRAQSIRAVNMQAESLTQINRSLPSQTFSSRSFAKKAVLKWFENLDRGHLIIIDGLETYHYGETKTQGSCLTACVKVEDQAFYADILLGGTIGAGESWMQGHWTSPDLVAAIRVLARNIHVLQTFNDKRNFSNKAFCWFYSRLTKNNLVGSRKNISAHYDLGNDFFSLFLDNTMMYSSGIFQNENDSLEQASLHKLNVICKKLQLKSTDHVVEIGTGWGGFAIYAAKHYGCKVTTTTISQEQYLYACEQVKENNLQDSVTVLMKDYRELEGRFDKLVSIEMIEAVGHQYFTTFFKKCNELLKEDGLMLIQAITISDQRYHKAKSSVDFIQRYIFPGGCLPSNSIFAEHLAKDTNMQLADLHDITYDYALTLEHWRKRYVDNLQEVRSLGYSDTFMRMWDFYLCYCEGAFRERVIQTSQFLASKPQCDYRSMQIR